MPTGIVEGVCPCQTESAMHAPEASSRSVVLIWLLVALVCEHVSSAKLVLWRDGEERRVTSTHGPHIAHGSQSCFPRMPGIGPSLVWLAMRVAASRAAWRSAMLWFLPTCSTRRSQSNIVENNEQPCLQRFALPVRICQYPQIHRLPLARPSSSSRRQVKVEVAQVDMHSKDEHVNVKAGSSARSICSERLPQKSSLGSARRPN